jgi:hypothetical protein
MKKILLTLLLLFLVTEGTSAMAYCRTIYPYGGPPVVQCWPGPGPGPGPYGPGPYRPGPWCGPGTGRPCGPGPWGPGYRPYGPGPYGPCWINRWGQRVCR